MSKKPKPLVFRATAAGSLLVPESDLRADTGPMQGGARLTYGPGTVIDSVQMSLPADLFNEHPDFETVAEPMSAQGSESVAPATAPPEAAREPAASGPSDDDTG
ncbi:MAG: hypothetical protein AAF845_05730 [Bacteroidota bacterium]